jgi:hypothetical protein
MATIIRKWKKCHPDTLWSIWDGGNEFWELKNGYIRHFSVIERSREGDLIIEKVQLLPESAIPLEVVRQSILGWEVEEVEAPQQLQQAQVQPQVQKQQPQVQKQQQQKQQQVQKQQPQSIQPPLRRKAAFQPLTQGPAFLPDTPEDASEHPPRQSQCQQPPSSNTQKIGGAKASEAKANMPEEHTEQGELQPQGQANSYSQSLESKEASLQDSYTPPTELWSALSQWIPPNALYQPSLHHQAFLELSGTQEKSYPGKKDSEVNVRHKEARRPYLAQARNSKPYQPKPFVQQPRAVGPLFI